MAISSSTSGVRPGVCTSTTRPSNPYLGQLVFETDTFVLKYWNGTIWQGAISAPAGTVNTFAGSTAPAGWLLAYGQAVSRTTYADLYAIVGNTYGAGDGSTTFNIPDMRGRVVAGEDDMGGTAASRLTTAVSGVDGVTLGAVGGNQIMHAHSHVNTAAFSGSFSGSAGTTGNDSPDHTHGYSRAINQLFAHTAGSSVAFFHTYDTPQTGGASTRHTHTFTPAGTISGTVTMTNATFPATAGGSSQNVQPTIVLNYIIKF